MADFGCHRIEVLLHLLGPVAEVHGFPANVRYREREVEDACAAHFRFRSGTTAVLEVSHAAAEPRDTFGVFGTRGSAHVGVLNLGGLRVIAPGGSREEPHPPHPNLHQPLVEDFLAAVREGRAPAVTGEVGLDVARVVARVYGG
jgi:predicted dehydrogenase